MPWESIASKLRDVLDGKVDWSVLPHAEEVLAKSVLFNLRIGNVFAWLRLTVEPCKSDKNTRAPAPPPVCFIAGSPGGTSIAAKLKDVLDGKVDWNILPQSEDILAKSVLFNLRIGNVFFYASPYPRNLKIR